MILWLVDLCNDLEKGDISRDSNNDRSEMVQWQLITTGVIQTGALATTKLKSQTCVWQKRIVYELKTET